MATSILRPEIENFFQEEGFSVRVMEYSDGPMLELQQYTPAGEDWYVTANCGNVEGLLYELQNIYEDFDVNDEVKGWADGSGKNGVPDIETLVKDAKWKDETLKALSEHAIQALGYLEDKDMFIKTDLSKTIEERPFTLVESTLEYQTDEPAFEMWMDTDVSDGIHKDVFDDLFFRADFDLSDENLPKSPKYLTGLKDIEGHEDAILEANLRICTNKTVKLYVKLTDDAMDGYYAATVPLTFDEQRAMYAMAEESLGAERLAFYLQKAQELYKEPVPEKTEVQKYAEKNFYDNEDIVRSYLQAATVGEVLDFIGNDAFDVQASSLMDTAEEVLAGMPDEELQYYAEAYAKKACAKGIKGQKFQDDLKKEGVER